MKKSVLVDCRASDTAVSSLSDCGFNVIKLPPDPSLSSPVASHPDLIFLKLGDRLICREGYLTEYPHIREAVSEALNGELVISPSVALPDYPGDVGLCAAFDGRRLFGRLSSLLPEVTDACLSLGIELINVSQGYAACTTVCPKEGRVITADPSVRAAAEKAGCQVLSISDGGISLPPYEHGFIGGCHGIFEGTVYFYGDPLTHQNGSEICSFIRQCGLEHRALEDGRLRDLGRMIFL